MRNLIQEGCFSHSDRSGCVHSKPYRSAEAGRGAGPPRSVGLFLKGGHGPSAVSEVNSIPGGISFVRNSFRSAANHPGLG